MRVKVMFVWLMAMAIGLILSCSKDDVSPEPEVKLSPLSFDISKKDLGHDFSEIQWTPSLILDKSKVVYDVYIEEELKGKDLETLSYRFEDLKALTTYNIEVIAKSIHKTQLVASYSFTTQDTPSPGTIVLKKKDVSTDKISVSWENSNSTQKLKYDIYLDDVLKAEDLDVNTYTFSDLEGEKVYKIKLVAKNEFDKTVESTLVLKTNDYAEPSDFTFKENDLSFNSAKIKWSGAESEKLTYTVLLDGTEKAKDLTVLDYEFTELKEKTPYTASVKAINEYGKIKEKQISFTTLEAGGPADFKISAENITITTALIRWETTGDKSEKLKYKIYVNNDFKADAQGDGQYLATKLEHGKVHTVKIEAKNIHEKILTKKFEFTTETISLSDFNLNSWDVKPTSAVLTWTKSVATDGSKVTYDVYHPNGARVKGGLEETEYQLTNLTPGKSFTYRVEVVSNDPNIRSVSKTVTFKTTNHEIPGDFELSLGEMKKTEARINWTNSELPSGGKITYEVYLDNDPYSYDASGNAFVFKNLDAGTPHTAKVIAKSTNNTKNVQTISFTTNTEPVPELTLNIVKRETRLVELTWSSSGTPSSDRYELFLDGKTVKSGAFKTHTFKDLKSSTTYKVKVIGTRNGKSYEKEVDITTKAYAAAVDWTIEVSHATFNNVQVNLADFKTKNPNYDLSHMTFEAILNGEGSNWGKGITSKNLTLLKAETTYNLNLKIKHADGSLASEKSISFTTPADKAPVWKGDLKIKQTGFSFLELENNFATDPEGGSLKYRYYVNGVMKNPNTSASSAPKQVRLKLGLLERRVNSNNKPILLSHLISNKEYTFYIIAIDPSGKETKSNVVKFTTGPDAKKVFEVRAAIDPSVKHVGPYWMKMGEKASIKEIRVKWVIDGKLLGGRGESVHPSKLVEKGNQHSLDLDYSHFLKVKPEAKISFSISIEWIDKEAFIGKSESNTIVITE